MFAGVPCVRSPFRKAVLYDDSILTGLTIPRPVCFLRHGEWEKR